MKYPAPRNPNLWQGDESSQLFQTILRGADEAEQAFASPQPPRGGAGATTAATPSAGGTPGVLRASRLSALLGESEGGDAQEDRDDDEGEHYGEAFYGGPACNNSTTGGSYRGWVSSSGGAGVGGGGGGSVGGAAAATQQGTVQVSRLDSGSDDEF